MIERLYAENYRAFPKLDIELSKINLFFGPNNSGKSSIISIINLLSQTEKSPDDKVPLLLRGTKEDLGTFRDLVHNHDLKKTVTIGIQYKPTYSYYPQRFKDYRVFIKLKFDYRPKRHEIVLNNIIINFLQQKIVLNIERSKAYNSDTYYLTQIQEKGKDLLKTKKRVEFFDHFIPSFFSDLMPNRDLPQFIRNFSMYFANEFKAIEFIGPFREPPLRTYMFSGDYPDTVGVRGERAIDILMMDHMRQKGKMKKNLVKKVSEWFKQCEISEHIRINPISDRHFEVVLSHKDSSTEENLADVGYGCSQVLPILVSGYNLRNGNTLVVQEPEIHLHPKAQAELGTFLYNLSKRNIQTIIETHSEHLLLRLQTHVANSESELSPEDIKIFYVSFENGKREITEIQLNKEGYFAKDWPKGFFPERYNEAKKIASKKLENW